MKKFYCEKKKALNEYLYMNVENVEGIIGEYQIIPEWLRVDVFDNVVVVEKIKKAIAGEEGKHYHWGNLYYAIFEKEYTTIKSFFYDEGDNRICSIPTKLLLAMINEWLVELRKFRKSKEDMDLN